MGFGIILMVLFGLLAAGILIIIICMLVIGLRRIPKKGESVEKQVSVKTDTKTPPEATHSQEASPVKNDSEKTP